MQARAMSSSSALVYGTLMAPEVLKVLIKRVPPMRPATLRGYMRCRIKGEVFPAIVPDAASEVRGQVSRGGAATFKCVSCM